MYINLLDPFRSLVISEIKNWREGLLKNSRKKITDSTLLLSFRSSLSTFYACFFWPIFALAIFFFLQRHFAHLHSWCPEFTVKLQISFLTKYLLHRIIDRFPQVLKLKIEGLKFDL